MYSIGPATMHRTILGIAVLGVILSLLAFTALHTQLANHSRLEFHWLAKDRVGALQRELNEAIHVVDILGDLLRARDASLMEFTQLAHTFFSKVHGIRELIWIPQFGVHAAQPLRAHRTHSIFPKEHDFQTDTSLMPLFQHAQNREEITVTTLFHPKPSGEMIEEFVVVVPLRHPPDGLSEHQTRGVLLGVFDLEELVQQAIRLLEPRGVQILILEPDEQGQERFLDSYYSRLEAKPEQLVNASNWKDWLARQPYVMRETVPVANKRWIINAIPSKHLLSGEEFPHTPWLIGAGGLIITTILVMFLLHMEHNLNEKNRLYAELKQSAIKLRIVFNQYPDTILTVDRHGKVLLANRPEVRVLGDLFGDEHAEVRDWYFQALHKVYTSGEMDHFQYPFSDTQWREVRFVPIRTEGDIAEVMILTSDITEEHTQQEQAVRYARLASLGVLAAGMAHEINNPNNTIQFNIVALTRGWPDMAAVLRQYRLEHGEFSLGGVPVDHALEMLPGLMESILSNSRRITGIVNNLKHMAKPDPDTRFSRVDLHKTIRNIVSIMQHPIKKHTDHFEVNLPPELPDVHGNPLQLEQLFLNLVLNSLESLQDRKSPVTLDGAPSEDGQWVVVQVMDQGVGMTEQEIANMFTPFFTTKGEQGGLGMGLSIVWDIVRRHGGTIQTASQPGHGTTITVTLPVFPLRSNPA
ncbi:MAG: hypothetical protein HQL98_14540 [Magnetococcales bacterium]|nr:hypothetical protein [Magnetococcales bacterium]